LPHTQNKKKNKEKPKPKTNTHTKIISNNKNVFWTRENLARGKSNFRHNFQLAAASTTTT